LGANRDSWVLTPWRAVQRGGVGDVEEARAGLGLTISPALLAQIDEIIQ
jgi:hypothetical protein